jgi:hypothetical protein
MTMLLALLLAAAGPDADDAPTYADLVLPLTLASEEQETRTRDRDQDSSSSRREYAPKYMISLGIEGRFTLPFGYANREVYYVSNPGGGATVTFNGNLGWNDIFSSGWGTSLVAEVTMMQTGRGGGEGKGRGNSSIGGYIAFSQDHLYGTNANDGHGNSFTAEDMTMNTYLVGMTLYQNVGGGFFTQGRLGLGAVHYSEVNAQYRFVFSPTFDAPLLADTWNFAMELRGGGGYRVGPFGFTLGIGGRMLFPPREAGPVASLESGIVWTFDIDAGVEIGF